MVKAPPLTRHMLEKRRGRWPATRDVPLETSQPVRHPPRLSMRSGIPRPLLTALLLALLGVSGCALQGRSTQRPLAATTATAASALASSTIYWSQGDHLWALRASDGTTRWKVGGWSGPLPNCANCDATFYSGPGNPILADGVLYALGYDAHAALNAYAIAASDGAIKWQTPVLGCQIVSEEPPVVAGGLVYLLTTAHQSGNFSCGTNTSWVHALRISDGAVQWKAPLDRSAYGSLALTDDVLVATASNYPDSPKRRCLPHCAPAMDMCCGDCSIQWNAWLPKMALSS